MTLGDRNLSGTEEQCLEASHAPFLRALRGLYPPWLTGFSLTGIRRDESAESDRLYQARFAHKGLIQQVAHDFQQNSRVLRGQIRLIGPGIAVAAEQYRAQDRKAFIVEVCEGADFLQRVEELQLAALAEFAE